MTKNLTAFSYNSIIAHMAKKVNIFMLFGHQKQLLHNILPIEV